MFPAIATSSPEYNKWEEGVGGGGGHWRGYSKRSAGDVVHQ